MFTKAINGLLAWNGGSSNLEQKRTSKKNESLICSLELSEMEDNKNQSIERRNNQSIRKGYLRDLWYFSSKSTKRSSRARSSKTYDRRHKYKVNAYVP